MEESIRNFEETILADDNFLPKAKSRIGSRAMSLYDITKDEDGDKSVSSQDSPPPEMLSSNEIRTLSQYEMNMERDIKELRVKPINTIQRLRRKGQELLNSKGVLLAVVILNCLDCILVLSELLLDVYFVKKMIDTAENTMEEFNSRLIKKYPKQFAGIFVHDTHKFYNQILRAHLVWNISRLTTVCVSGKTGFNSSSAALKSLGFPNETDQKTTYFEDADDPEFLEDQTHSIEEKISHTFHEISIVLLGVLVIYTLLNILCHGLSFLKHKLQVFDCVVVLASFGLDVGYMKGLTHYHTENFIPVLAVMIPWRIIRVLNSLVIAVNGKFQFLLKLMHMRNKLQKKQLKYLERENRSHQKVIESLRLLCSMHSIAVEDALVMPDRTNRTERRKTEKLFCVCSGRHDSLDVSECMYSPYLMVNPSGSQSVLKYSRSRDHDDRPTGRRYGESDVEMLPRPGLLSSKIRKYQSSF